MTALQGGILHQQINVPGSAGEAAAAAESDFMQGCRFESQSGRAEPSCSGERAESGLDSEETGDDMPRRVNRLDS